MNDLIEFVKARLDDDERVARATAATSSGSWRVTAKGEVRDSDGIGIVHSAHTLMTMRAEAEHIATWDPARTLALIEALRGIVDDFHGEAQEARVIMTITEALYGQHPDYLEEWRP